MVSSVINVDNYIDNQLKGLIIKPTKKIIPTELLNIFIKKPELGKSFNQLTPGRQREYVAHINTAKKAETKLSRIEKIIPLIIDK